MIEKLKATNIPNQIYSKAPGNFELMEKINEIIGKINELDIKLHTVKYFTPSQEKGVKELLELLEKDNSVGAVLNVNNELGDEK